MARSNNIRSCFWTVVFYPDRIEGVEHDYCSFLSYLIASHICFCVSPLHSPDRDNELLPSLKRHYHFIIRTDKARTLGGFSQLLGDYINGCAYPQPVTTLPTMIRYLAHLDNPEKQQFASGLNSIKFYNGFRPEWAYWTSQATMLEYIKDFCIPELSEYTIDSLIDFVLHEPQFYDRHEVIRYIQGHVNLIREIMPDNVDEQSFRYCPRWYDLDRDEHVSYSFYKESVPDYIIDLNSGVRFFREAPSDTDT